MAFLFENNAVSTLAAGIGTGDTSLSVQGGDGTLFPSPSGGDSFRATLVDSSNNIEIVDVTARVGDAMTITRAQEGTSAKAYLAGDAFELRLTKEVLATYRQGNGSGVFAVGINTSLGLADRHQIYEATSPIQFSLADANTMGKGYQVTIKNNSTGVVTITRGNAADTIDGVLADMSLAAGDAVYFSVNQATNGYVSMFDALEKIYPIGSVYMNATDATNPGTLLGFGVWVSIPGRFLVGVGDNGDGKAYTSLESGGLKDQIIPEHNHSITDSGHIHGIRGGGNDDDGGPRPPGGNNNSGTLEGTQNATTGITIDNEGEDATDKNLPPYLAVYLWRRVS